MNENDKSRSGLQTAVDFAHAARAVKRIMQAAAVSGVHGAAAATAREAFPVLLKILIAALVVFIVVPMVIFTALPNIFFGYNSSGTDIVMQMTQQAMTLGGVYMTLGNFEGAQIDSVVTGIAAEYEKNGTTIDHIVVSSAMTDDDLLWVIAINSAAHQQDLNTMSADLIRDFCKSSLSYDDYKYTNGNWWIGGSTGAGKTVTLQCLGGRLRQQGKRVIIIAPKKGHEFRPLCEKLGGLYLRMSPSSKDCPNLMAIRRKSLDSYAKLKNIAARDDSVLADSAGHISNKTLYIALNYEEQAERMNAESAHEIAKELFALECEQRRLTYFIGLLDKRQAEVIRLVFMDGIPTKEVAASFGLTYRTIDRIKRTAIENLAEMYAYSDQFRV